MNRTERMNTKNLTSAQLEAYEAGEQWFNDHCDQNSKMKIYSTIKELEGIAPDLVGTVLVDFALEGALAASSQRLKYLSSR